MDIYLDHDKVEYSLGHLVSTSLTGWQGEGKGTTANQGKVSLGPLNYILKSNGIKPLPESHCLLSLLQILVTHILQNGMVQFQKNEGKKSSLSSLPKNQKVFDR